LQYIHVGKKKQTISNQLDINFTKNFLEQSLDLVNKMRYNEYTKIDKLIYQIN